MGPRATRLSRNAIHLNLPCKIARLSVSTIGRGDGKSRQPSEHRTRIPCINPLYVQSSHAAGISRYKNYRVGWTRGSVPILAPGIGNNCAVRIESVALTMFLQRDLTVDKPTALGICMSRSAQNPPSLLRAMQDSTCWRFHVQYRHLQNCGKGLSTFWF